MPEIQLYILSGLMVVFGLLPALVMLCINLRRRHPLMFAQATVVEVTERTAAFELFDGQVIELSLGRSAIVHEGDYGRLTYRGGKFLQLEPETPHKKPY